MNHKSDLERLFYVAGSLMWGCVSS